MLKDADDLARLVRVMSASVNVHILAELVAARRDADGWLGLSEIARRVNENPGTVSVAVQKLVPTLAEEKYEKGRRYFRARVTGVKLVFDGAPPGFP